MDRKTYEFISKQTNDPIVERKTCAISWQEFAVFQSDLEFYDKISPVFDWQKFQIPTPTLSPEERQRRRLSWRNERNLYYRNCDKSGKKIISMYSPESPYVVYDKNEWRSDNWNPLDYGFDFDFSQSFFSQYDKLMKQVPHASMNMANDNVNSEFTNYSVSNKNVYMSFGPTENEDCMYWKFINKCKRCVDCLSTYMCERCHEGYDSVNCYKCSYFINSTDCDSCLMVENCNNCKYCIASVWLNNKEYYYLNKHIWKEKYEALIKKIYPLSEKNISLLEKAIQQVKSAVISPYANIQKCEDSSGDMLVNCKDTVACFDMVNIENCKYSRYAKNSIWSWDNSFNDPTWIEYCYETCSTLSQRCSFVFFTLQSTSAHYCVECFSCHNIFGCVWLRNKEYCIFNKQYTQKEYELLVPRIITHMQKYKERWEFFPTEMSPYCYNESVAFEYFSLSKQESLDRKYRRKDELVTINIPENAETIESEDIVQDPNTRGLDLTKKVLICQKSKRPYRIIEDELDFYQKMNIGIPKLHPDERHYNRIARKPDKDLHLKTCNNCGEEHLSVYPQDTKLTIYCKKCYDKEIYW